MIIATAAHLCRPHSNWIVSGVDAPDSAPSATPRAEDDSKDIMLRGKEFHRRMPIPQRTCHIHQFCATACGAQTN
ncbi:hypothetical protein J6590_080732 [Homalodisca vitripennis]|nr:hypothetical protein J6590_080732 [Homalodisca vitripennis]